MSDDLQFPVYQPPGPPTADHKQAGPMIKLISKMMKPRLKMPRGKGVQSDQNVHVKHKGKKQVKFY